MPDLDLEDSNNYPLTVDCFVKVAQRSKTLNRTSHYRGLVKRIDHHRENFTLTIREWRNGRWTGKERLARPEACEVVRAPKAIREEQAERARRKVRS